MKLKDLNKNNIRLGLRKTDPSLRVPTSNNLAVKSDMDEQDKDSDMLKQSLVTKDLMDIQKMNDPNNKIPDVRRINNSTSLIP